MTNDRKTPRDLDEIDRDLDELLAGCAGTSRHDQAIVAISFCIDEDLDTASLIAGVLRGREFNRRHLMILLHRLEGNDPARHYWQSDEAGHYRNLTSA